MSHGHQDPDTSPRTPAGDATIPPLRPRKYKHQRMTRKRAFDIAIAFGQHTGLPCLPIQTRDLQGWDVVIPAEYLEGLFERIGALPSP